MYQLYITPWTLFAMFVGTQDNGHGNGAVALNLVL
jgi:hypothetical protein